MSLVLAHEEDDKKPEGKNDTPTDASATIRGWFYNNYENPAESLPYNSIEGGWGPWVWLPGERPYLFPSQRSSRGFDQFRGAALLIRVAKWGDLGQSPDSLVVGGPARASEKVKKRRSGLLLLRQLYLQGLNLRGDRVAAGQLRRELRPASALARLGAV